MAQLETQAKHVLLFLAATCILPSYISAQQRPLATEDPRLIQTGTMVLETGLAYTAHARFPLPNLQGTELSIADSGIHFGLGTRSEFQLRGVVQNVLRTSGGLNPSWRHDVGDLAISTKILLLDEDGHRPVIAFQPSVVLPNANQASGLGLNTTRFFGNILAGKHLHQAFLFTNLGLGIIDDPVRVAQQQDVLKYGVASTIPLNSWIDLAFEWNGIFNPRTTPSPGTESRAHFLAGLQWTCRTMRCDLGLSRGLTSGDSSFGISLGVSRTFTLHR